MSKKRVYELAKELDVPSKDLVEKAQKLGIDVKNHMSTLSEDNVKQIKGVETKPNTSHQKRYETNTPAFCPKSRK